jgi:capsular exopolysaccharide synthesis family protein
MSRNFELLERAGVAREITSVIAAKPAPTLVPQSGNGQRHEAGFNLDRIAREECLKLVQRVFLMQTDTSSRAVVFAGIDRGNGCSRTCAGAAQVLAENVPGSVCVVDANLHSPALAGFFGVANHNGLADSVLSQGLVRRFTQQLRPENLSLLSCGAASGENANLLNSDRLTTWMKALREEFDYVLIDAPPLNQHSDAAVFAQRADGLVLVVEANSTRRESAVRVMERLREAQIVVLGAVLNKRTFPIPEALYNRL